ncbi:cyclin E-interacting protein minus [Lasioglossum baleicum]|uniref:cyclin E-interacting protein minus n=1 Tax=Lasioglossum baleicum TaxID=434251 RepID=UPI003FCED95F
MDCCYFNKNGSLESEREFPNISSPEMFNSDDEGGTSSSETVEHETTEIPASPEKPSQADLVAKSDNNLLGRINKSLSGIPPPPKHTICRTDCSELLLRIYENYQLFWTPNVLPEKQLRPDVKEDSPEQQKENISTNNSLQLGKSTSRNLSIAFDACDPQFENNISGNLDTKDVTSNICSDNFRIEQVVTNNKTNVACTVKSTTKTLSTEQVQATTNIRNTKEASSTSLQEGLLLYHTTDEKEVNNLTWPEAYHHKFHGIHYNRSKAVEDFENLSMKLCERYIGGETQSTCTVWFSKPAPGSAKKRNLLAKRDNGQSPGKRLSHLTRRRRTFSSANLQGLALNNKKLLVLNIKKPTIKKGKSPRGKSPRCKSPRGTPRSSTKKKVSRRLVLDGSSPLKAKVETSKRALFQSPPSDRAGPSKLFSSGTNAQSIKRALFSTGSKENNIEVIQKIEESRKRKNEEELEGPRFKWPKSLSFDCSHEIHNKSTVTWDRHSSSNLIEKTKSSSNEGRTELSDAHRKKLLWAVAEALRSKGIGMTHPQFKQYATNLAKTIKKYMPDLENKNIPRKPGSTSDRMLKLAKHHVLFIIEAGPTD